MHCYKQYAFLYDDRMRLLLRCVCLLQLTGDWAFGTALCHIIPTVFGVVVYASTLSLTVIAVDRFALIVVGVKRRLSPTVALILVLVIAVFSTVVALPMAVFSRHVVFTDPELRLSRRSCVERWPSRQIRKLYTVVTLAVQYFLPLLVIGILYLLVSRHVRASRKQTGSRRRKSRTNRMLAAVVLVFAVAWTPYQLFSVVSEFDPRLVRGPYFRFVDLMLRVVAMGSSGVNPFLYGWMNANFRAAFATILRRRRLPTGAGNHRGAVTEADEFCTPNVERRAIVMRPPRGDDDENVAQQHLALCQQFPANSVLSVSATADVHEAIEVAAV